MLDMNLNMNRETPRRRFYCALLSTVALSGVLAGCTSLPPHPQIDSLGAGFSGQMALAHYQSLRGLQPRLAGGERDAQARAYLAREFQDNGAIPGQLMDAERRHLMAEIPGASHDVILLVAAYSDLEASPWLDDSGVAVLLELSRVYGSSKPLYTLRFVFAETTLVGDGGALAIDSRASDPAILTAAVVQKSAALAGRRVAAWIEAEGDADRVRAVITLHTVNRPNRRLVRDLRSQPTFRGLFWESAAAGPASAELFLSEGIWDAPESLHMGFLDSSMDRVVALVDQAVLSAEPLEAGLEEIVETSPDGFETLGAVIVEGLSRLMLRLEKVDAFSR